MSSKSYFPVWEAHLTCRFCCQRCWLRWTLNFPTWIWNCDRIFPLQWCQALTRFGGLLVSVLRGGFVSTFSTTCTLCVSRYLTASITSKTTWMHWHVVLKSPLGTPPWTTGIAQDRFLWRSVSPQWSCCNIHLILVRTTKITLRKKQPTVFFTPSSKQKQVQKFFRLRI